ncbi:hypothetical protein FRC03_002532, partial [Tulasnella sp. 419]
MSEPGSSNRDGPRNQDSQASSMIMEVDLSSSPVPLNPFLSGIHETPSPILTSGSPSKTSRKRSGRRVTIVTPSAQSPAQATSGYETPRSTSTAAESAPPPPFIPHFHSSPAHGPYSVPFSFSDATPQAPPYIPPNSFPSGLDTRSFRAPRTPPRYIPPYRPPIISPTLASPTSPVPHITIFPPSRSPSTDRVSERDYDGDPTIVTPSTPSPFTSVPLPPLPVLSGRTERGPELPESSYTQQEGMHGEEINYQAIPPVDTNIATKLDQYSAFWDAYNKEADIQDKELVKGLSGDLDVLLIFAGLFSATNTAFIIEAYRDLKQDTAETTNALLQSLILHLRDPQSGDSEPQSPPPFVAKPRATRVNALFFASLCCSIFAAFGAVIAKQWMTHYEREGQLRSPSERGRVRHKKYMGLKWWHLIGIVETLPTLLQLSLFFFFAALIDFLWPLNFTVAVVVITFGLLTFLFYIITTTIATVFPNSPFQTRFSAILRRLLQPLIYLFGVSQSSTSLKDAIVDSHCIKWLLTTTTVPNTSTLAAKALLMLPDTVRTEIGLNEASSILRILFKPSVIRGQVELGASIMNVIPSLEELSALMTGWDYKRQWVLPTMETHELFMRSFRRELLNVFIANPTDIVAGNCVADILKWIGVDHDTPAPYIDRLFTHILHQSIPPEESSEYLWDYRTIMGAIVVLHPPYRLEDISKLLLIEETKLLATLTSLKALITVNPTPHGHDVNIVHRSFYQFIITRERCPYSQFLLDPSAHHLDVTSNCLRLMINNLKHYTSDEDSLTQREELTLPSHLHYACCHWASHLEQSPPNDANLVELVMIFCKEMLPHWMEALGRARRLDVARKSLEITRKWLTRPTAWSLIPNTNIASRIEVRLQMAARFVSDFSEQMVAKPSNARYWESLLMNISSSDRHFPDACLEDTRTWVLEKIDDWIDGKDDENAPIIVIKGAIGSGKSAIAQTIVERLINRGRFGACIFFRQETLHMISHVAHVLAILATQLAQYYPHYRQQLLDLSRDISLESLDSSLSYSLERLRSVMLDAITSEGLDLARQRVVLVIDGLESYPDLGGLRSILELFMLPTGLQEPPIRILVTTRPEVNVLSMVHSLRAEPSDLYLMDLDHIYLDDTDIHAVIYDRLLNTDVQDHQIRDLSKWAGTSFMAATAVSSYVAATYPSMGAGRYLQKFLYEGGPSSEEVYNDVDGLYLETVRKVLAQDVVRVLGREILASAILLFDNSFSIERLGLFLDHPLEELAAALAAMQSLITIEAPLSNGIRLVHTSLGTYLTTRCTNGEISLVGEDYHTHFTMLCLKHMNKFLKRDICNIGSETCPNWEVENFTEKAQKAIPPHIRYACYHWASHLHFAPQDNEGLIQSLEIFCSTKLLNWIEVLSLFGCLYVANPIIDKAKKWLIVNDAPNRTRIIALLEDCQRLVRSFSIPISHCALHVYGTALALSNDGPIYDCYHGELTSPMKLITSGSVSSDAQDNSATLAPIFSRDGGAVLTVALGKSSDSVKIWDIVLDDQGNQKVQLRSSLETRGVCSQVALSPDGMLVAIPGFNEKPAIGLWNTESSTESPIRVLDHAGGVE